MFHTLSNGENDLISAVGINLKGEKDTLDITFGILPTSIFHFVSQ